MSVARWRGRFTLRCAVVICLLALPMTAQAAVQRGTPKPDRLPALAVPMSSSGGAATTG